MIKKYIKKIKKSNDQIENDVDSKYALLMFTDLLIKI